MLQTGIQQSSCTPSSQVEKGTGSGMLVTIYHTGTYKIANSLDCNRKNIY